MAKTKYTEEQLNKKHVVMFYTAGNTQVLLDNLIEIAKNRENTKCFVAGKLPAKVKHDLKPIEVNYTHNLPEGAVRTLNLGTKTKINDFYEFCRLAKYSVVLCTEKFNDYAEIMPVFETEMKGIDFMFELSDLSKLAEFVGIFDNQNVICCLPITKGVNEFFMDQNGFRFDNIEKLQAVFNNQIIAKIMFACTEANNGANLLYNISAGIVQGEYSSSHNVDVEAQAMNAFIGILSMPSNEKEMVNAQIMQQLEMLAQNDNPTNILNLPDVNL